MVATFTFLAVARFIDFPVSMFVVTGRSMEPNLLIGDLIFGVKRSYNIGDIVVIGGLSKESCIVHRVLNMTEEYVITKGDANPGPDAPISRDHVLYKVVYVVPRLLSIPPILGALLFLTYRFLKSILRAAGMGRVLIRVLLFFSILDVVYVGLMPIFHVHQQVELRRPNIQLESTSLSDDFRVFRAVYTNVELLELVGVNWTIISAAGREFTPENTSIEGSALVVGVPAEVYEALYANASETSSFWVYCNIVLDRGVLYGYYPVTFSWKRLEANVFNNTVIVFNPNPVVINASFEIQYYDLDRFGRLYYISSYKFEHDLQPVSNFTVKPEKRGVTCYVVLRYVLLGQSIVESRKVNLVGD